jgi:alpha-mannosidase
MADNKKYNRQMEILLRDVEIISSLAQIVNPQGYKYKTDEIREMWRTFLIDQFHDVLPGTCIGMVYDDTKRNSEELTKQSDLILFEAFSKLIEKIG